MTPMTFSCNQRHSPMLCLPPGTFLYHCVSRQKLERMESLGIISKVDEPTPWCAGKVVAPKKGGAIRICVDYQPLNRYVCREVSLPKVDETLAQLAGAKIFNANSGFWQIPLTVGLFHFPLLLDPCFLPFYTPPLPSNPICHQLSHRECFFIYL